MSITAETVRKALIRRKGMKSNLIALPLIPGDNPADCVHEVDLAVMCRSLRVENGDFDWISGCLPYWDSNGEVLSSEGYRLLGAAQCFLTSPGESPIPVLAGLSPLDPFREHDQLLREALSRGYSGIHNYPSIGLMDGLLRMSFEQQRMGYEREVAFVRRATELNIFALAMVFSIADALVMRDAGAGGVLVHPGIVESSPEAGQAYVKLCRDVKKALPADTAFFTCAPESIWEVDVAHSLLEMGGCYLCNMRQSPYVTLAGST